MACLALLAVFAEIFIFTHLIHDCTGEDCAICEQIEIAQRVLEKLGRIAAAVFLAFTIADYTKLLVKPSVAFLFQPSTPVSLKIRINS
jgi:hypothetical protein